MLILTRKSGESITIGEDIKIQVIEIKGRQVRLGIDAPKDCIIHREEVYLRIKKEGKNAVSPRVSLQKLEEAFKPDK